MDKGNAIAPANAIAQAMVGISSGDMVHLNVGAILHDLIRPFMPGEKPRYEKYRSLGPTAIFVSWIHCHVPHEWGLVESYWHATNDLINDDRGRLAMMLDVEGMFYYLMSDSCTIAQNMRVVQRFEGCEDVQE